MKNKNPKTASCSFKKLFVQHIFQNYDTLVKKRYIKNIARLNNFENSKRQFPYQILRLRSVRKRFFKFNSSEPFPHLHQFFPEPKNIAKYLAIGSLVILLDWKNPKFIWLHIWTSNCCRPQGFQIETTLRFLSRECSNRE